MVKRFLKLWLDAPEIALNWYRLISYSHSKPYLLLSALTCRKRDNKPTIAVVSLLVTTIRDWIMFTTMLRIVALVAKSKCAAAHPERNSKKALICPPSKDMLAKVRPRHSPHSSPTVLWTCQDWWRPSEMRRVGLTRLRNQVLTWVHLLPPMSSLPINSASNHHWACQAQLMKISSSSESFVNGATLRSVRIQLWFRVSLCASRSANSRCLRWTRTSNQLSILLATKDRTRAREMSISATITRHRRIQSMDGRCRATIARARKVLSWCRSGKQTTRCLTESPLEKRSSLAHDTSRKDSTLTAIRIGNPILSPKTMNQSQNLW